MDNKKFKQGLDNAMSKPAPDEKYFEDRYPEIKKGKKSLLEAEKDRLKKVRHDS